MLTNLVLTHPCGTAVHLHAGAWTTPRGAVLTTAKGCGEWLGSAFIRAEEAPRPARCRTSRRVTGVI